MRDFTSEALAKIARSHELDTNDLGLLNATQGIALAILALAQPQQVAITDEMVERGAEAAWNAVTAAIGGDTSHFPWAHASDADKIDARIQIRAAFKAVFESSDRDA